LVQHHKSDIWTLPGGHVDEGETLHQAMKREIKEEFNIKMKFL
jgi:ADP-ribose pyrophosphatase YjhB (NUDIX family)